MLARLVLASMLLAVTGLGAADDKKDEKNDKDLIQGEWVVVESTIPQQVGKKIIVKGDEWTSPAGRKSTMTIDPSKKPKQLDHTRKDENVTFLGIYKLEDGKLTYCREKMAKGIRPTELKATPNNDLLILKRATDSPGKPSK